MGKFKQTSIKNLTTKHFQHQAGTVGGIVTDIDDIEQCYDTIFNTSKGDIPYNPNLGTDIFKAIGEAPSDAEGIISKILQEEFTKQEPRGEILEIETECSENGQFEIFVKFKSKLTEEIKEKYYTLKH